MKADNSIHNNEYSFDSLRLHGFNVELKIRIVHIIISVLQILDAQYSTSLFRDMFSADSYV